MCPVRPPGGNSVPRGVLLVLAERGGLVEPTQEQASCGQVAGQDTRCSESNASAARGDSGDGTISGHNSLADFQPAAKRTAAEPGGTPAIPEADDGKPSQNQNAVAAQTPASKAAPTAGPFQVKKHATRDYFDIIVIRNGDKLPESSVRMLALKLLDCQRRNGQGT